MDSGQLFTGQEILTLSGAVALTLIVVNAIRYALDWSPKWLGLVVAVIINLVAWHFWTPRTLDALALSLVNAFVVYAASTGGNAIIGGLRYKPIEAPISQGTTAVYADELLSTEGFWRPWW